MLDLRLQFQPSDISDRFREFHEGIVGKDIANVRLHYCAEVHALKSPLGGVSQYIYFLRSIGKKKEQLSDQDFEYLIQLQKLNAEVGASSDELFSSISEGEFHEDSVHTLAEQYYSLLQRFADSFPLEERIEFSELPAEGMKAVFEANIFSRMFLYNLNKIFCKKRQTSIFCLSSDFTHFYSTNCDSFKMAGINLQSRGIDPLISSQDYLTNVVVPIVFNALDHAFGLQTSPDNEDEIIVSGELSGDLTQYTITIEDNGRGIAPEVQPQIFERGFSTKPEDGTTHGIGLYGVKEFVEHNGGVIHVESKVKRGTKFTIRIPSEVK